MKNVIWAQIYSNGKSDPETVFYPIKQVGFLNQRSSSPTPFHTHFVFSCSIFCSFAYFMISSTEHCVYLKLNCTLEKEIKKSKFLVMETLVHTRKIK